MAPSECFHTQEEWDHIKPTFTKLYQEKRLKLDEVRRILATEFDFPTTPKQCKTKIKEWGLGKYKKQRELLHAKRLFDDGRRRGRHVEIRLRGELVTYDDIAKHFKRKATEMDDLEQPASPPPQELEYASRENSPDAEEIQRHDVDFTDGDFQANGALARYGDSHFDGTSSHHHFAFPTHHNSMTLTHTDHCIHINSHVPSVFGIDPTERGFFNLRNRVEYDFGDIQNTYPAWWKDLDQIVVDFDNAQYSWMASRFDEAQEQYDQVLGAVTRYTRLPSMALLQFVCYLLSWAAIPVSGDVVKRLFSFLQDLSNDPQNNTNPALQAILPCLLASPEHASCSIALFQECIHKYVTEQLGRNSITVLRMNLRLCRHVFTMDDQTPAWTTLREISNIRKKHAKDVYSVIEPGLDQELHATLDLFEESIRDKKTIESHMVPCTNLFNTSQVADQNSPKHSLCNFKLGLYAIAYKQAKATYTCFRKVYPDDHEAVYEARRILARIDAIKKEIKDAGVVWPQDPTDAFQSPQTNFSDMTPNHSTTHYHNHDDATSCCDSPADWRPSHLHRHSSADSAMFATPANSFDSPVNFSSPHMLMDDYTSTPANDSLYQTFTNQSDIGSITSHPRRVRVNSNGTQSRGSFYSTPGSIGGNYSGTMPVVDEQHQTFPTMMPSTTQQRFTEIG